MNRDARRLSRRSGKGLVALRFDAGLVRLNLSQAFCCVLSESQVL